MSPIALRLLLCLTMPLVALPGIAALPPEIPAHQLVRQQWTVADGLPQITVLDLAQDPQGFLWLATQDGVARFDGHRFDGFRLRDHPQLNHNYSNAVAVERDGTVWVGTTLGLSRGTAGGFVSLTRDGAPTGAVYRLLPARDGGVWVGAERGLFRARGDALQPVALPDIPNRRVVALAADADGRVAVALTDRLLLDPHAAPRELRIDGVSELRSLAAGRRDGGPWLWVGGTDGVVGIDADGAVVARHLRGREVEALLEDSDGTLWAATDDGVWRVTEGARARRAAIPELGASTWIRALLQDHEGNLWVGTHVGGLFRLHAGVFRRIGAADGLTDDLVWSVYEDPQGGVWAGTPNGVFHGDLDGFRQVVAGDALPHPMALAFLRGSDGWLWIGTRQGAVRLPPGGGAPQPVAGVEAMVYSLAEDARGRIWIGSRQGVQRWTRGRVETLGSAHGLPAATARGIVEMSDGSVWVGTDLGVYIEDAGGFRPLAPGSGLDGFRVQMMREVRPGEVLLAVQGGMAHTTLIGRRMRFIGENDGLHVGMVMSVAALPGQQLAYTTHDGIGVLPLDQLDAWLAGRRERLQPRVVGRLDEPQAAQCNGGHSNAGMLVDGRWLWCPSLNGALVLDLDAMQRNAPPPLPVIRTLRSGTLEHRIDGGDGAPLRLPLGARDLQIDYTGILLHDPAAVHYRVQLVGYDEHPQAVGERRTAFYTNLPPGPYRFEVQAFGRTGDAALPAATLEFRVPPRMYETRWFQGLLLLAAAAAAFALLRLRLRQLEQQRRTLTELVRQRTHELEQANEKLLQSSVTDPLTGLRNRRYLLNEIRQDIAQVDRMYAAGREDPNRDLLFLMIDLDHFKQLNDRHGHHTGDQVLVQLARILAEQVRECDYVVRWGGEEFLVIGRQVDRAHSTVLASRIVEAVRAHAFVTDHGTLRCSCSVGIAVYPPLPGRPAAFGWQEAVELADAGTYLAKQEGRDRWIELRIDEARAERDFMTAFRRNPQALIRDGVIEVRRERPL